MLVKHWISHLRHVGVVLAVTALAACGGGGGGGGGDDDSGGGGGSSDGGTVTNISLPYSSTLSGASTAKITYGLLLSASSSPVSVWTTGGTGGVSLEVLNPQGQSVCFKTKTSGANVSCGIETPTTGTWKIVVSGTGSGAVNNVKFDALTGSPISSLPNTSSALTGTLNSAKNFTFFVPASTTAVQTQLSAHTGNANIRLISPSGKFCESNQDPTVAEDCAFNNPTSGLWTVRVIGTAAYSGTALTVETRATIPGRASDTTTATLASEPFALAENAAQPLTNLAGTKDSTKTFNFTVAAGVSTITARLSGGTGDADLYVFNTVGKGAVCRTVGDANAETCTILNPEAGTWSVVVYGWEAYSAATLSLTASSN